MPECKLIDNNAKLQISFYSALLTLGLFLVLGNSAMYNFTSPVLHSTGEGIGLGGLIGHALLAALITGVVTYISMPSGDQKSCKVD